MPSKKNKKEVWNYNKGEWSEIYTFAYLLNSGVLYSADKDLNKIEDIYFPIIKVIREENVGTPIDYFTGETIRIYKGDILLKEVEKSQFDKITNTLLEKIPLGAQSFTIPEADSFFKAIYCEKIKASSRKKEDITLQLHDIHTGIKPTLGFSIKSYLGGNPTLFNASKGGTNFIFEIGNCNDNIMNAFNKINTKKKLIDRILYLKNSSCVLNPIPHSISSQFEENLQFIDTLMPQLLQHIVFYSYWHKLNNITEIIEKIKEDNPLKYSNTEIYTYKTKKLLTAFALGLVPERSDWCGVEDANGGYITVKSDGSVVCYHLYNRAELEDYLYNYTYLDRPSSSKKKYDYMEIYKEDNKYKVKLCLQIRFR